MRMTRLFAAAALGLACSLALAAEPEQAIRKTLQSLQPDLPIEGIAPSPLPGLYQVLLTGGRSLYVSADGQFVLQGALFQVKDGEAIDLTAAAERQGVAKEIGKVPLSEMVVFSPKEPKTHITVFTATDCGYCQKLHSEMPDLLRQGVEVRYMAFPRQEVGSEGYSSLVSVWCAKDRAQAMNKAKARERLPAAECDNPVAKHHELGMLIGVNGTPAIVLANGQMVPGYRPAAELAKLALEAQ